LIKLSKFDGSGSMSATTDDLQGGVWSLTFEVDMNGNLNFQEVGIDYVYESTVQIDGNKSLVLTMGDF